MCLRIKQPICLNTPANLSDATLPAFQFRGSVSMHRRAGARAPRLPDTHNKGHDHDFKPQ